jgi:hypothetical protein
MITAAKNYVVEDAEPGVSSGIPAATFPATLTGLLDALGAARYPQRGGGGSDGAHRHRGQPTAAHPQVRGRPTSSEITAQAAYPQVGRAPSEVRLRYPARITIDGDVPGGTDASLPGSFPAWPTGSCGLDPLRRRWLAARCGPASVRRAATGKT